MKPVSEEACGSGAVPRIRPTAAAVARAGLEHLHPAGRAARLHVEDEADAPGQRVAVEEGVGAQQAGLLAVGEQDDHVAGRDAAGLDGADDLQRRGDAGRVVGGAGRARARCRSGPSGPRPARRGRVPGRTPTRFSTSPPATNGRLRPCGWSRRRRRAGPAGCRPSAVIRASRWSRAAWLAAEPIGWGTEAMAAMSAMARSAEKAVAGALAGAGLRRLLAGPGDQRRPRSGPRTAQAIVPRPSSRRASSGTLDAAAENENARR